MARRRDTELRIAATRNQRADRIARLPLGHVGADPRHMTGDLQTQDRGGTRWRRVMTLPLEHVRPVHAGVMNFDQYLCSGGRGDRSFGHAQALRRAVRSILDEFHRLIIPCGASI
jgi:hypothetical protein